MFRHGQKRRSGILDPYQGLSFSLVVLVSSHVAAAERWQAGQTPTPRAPPWLPLRSPNLTANSPPLQGAIFLGLSASGNFNGSVEEVRRCSCMALQCQAGQPDTQIGSSR